MNKTIKNFALGLAIGVLALPGFLLAADSGSSGSSKPGQDLAKSVRHEILMLPYYNIFDDIGFSINGNTVTLAGDVTRPVLKSDAGNVVRRIEGVGQVINNIKVLPLSPFDNQIRRAEYRSIFSYSSMYRYAMGAHPTIHIIVDNGHVTLLGVVGSQADKNIAGIRANTVPGVFSVTNNLVVEHS